MPPDEAVVRCSTCGRINRPSTDNLAFRCDGCDAPLAEALPHRASSAQTTGGVRNSVAQDLNGALHQLNAAAVAMAADVRDRERIIAVEPRRLRRVVESLESRPPRPPRNPERYLNEWRAVQAGSLSRLSERAVRNLAWVSDVALSKPFHDYLESARARLGIRALKGLTTRYHYAWSASDSMNDIAWSIRSRVNEFDGRHPAINRWSTSTAKVFGPGAPAKFADEIIRLGPSEAAKVWQIEELSAFFGAALRAAARSCRENLSDPAMQDAYFDQILTWPHWATSDTAFKAELSAAILDDDVDRNGLRERLQDFLIRHPRLGDPRLQDRNWLGVSQEARDRVLQLLSQEDIVFFFDHVFPRGQDPHGRKKFWLRFLKSIRVSRPLLSPVDRSRLLRDRQKVPGHCGTLRGVNSNSAFLLQFRGVLIVEFTKVGKVYFFSNYQDRVVPDFWAIEPFEENILKNQILHDAAIPHLPVDGWQYKVEEKLAEYGIQPDRRRP